MKRWRAIGAGAIVLGLTAVMAACSGGSSSPSGSDALSGDPIKVGAVFPLSGSLGPAGTRIITALQVEADLINAQGGVLGRPLEIVTGDDKGEPAVAVTAATSLVSEDVQVMFGGYSSTTTLAMAPVIDRAGLVHIAFTQAPEILDAEGTFRVNLEVTGLTPSFVALLKEAGASKVAFMTENDVYGNNLQQQIQDAATDARPGIEVVDTQLFPIEQTDFRIPISTIQSKNADTIIVINNNRETGLPSLIKQLSDAGVSATVIIAPGTFYPSVAESVGAAADGMLSGDIYFPESAPFSDYESNNAFVQAYQKKTGGLPDKNDALNAAGLQAWAAAVEGAGTLDRDPVTEWLKSNEVSDTIIGPLSFDERGQGQFTLYVYRVEGGKQVDVQAVPAG